MATQNEIAAFEGLGFKVGQKIKSKLPGFAVGFIVERRLVEDAGGIQRAYVVRHGPTSYEIYREFEIEPTI